MKNTWIIVANGGSAKILHQKKHGDPITTIQAFSHPRTAKKQASEKTPNDTPLRHAIDYDQNLEEYERGVFAREIAGFLSQALNQHRFESLIIAASPDMIGELRKELSPQLKHVVLHEMVKDLLSQHIADDVLLEKISNDLP